MAMNAIIIPEWPLPAGVRCCSSTRQGGVSKAPFDSLNLGAHCGDDSKDVDENRRRLCESAGLPSTPVWLEQIHGTQVLALNGENVIQRRADAAYSRLSGQICTVMTADCLPVLFCNLAGNEVAAAHAGWRGLCEGILEKTVASFCDKPSNIMAWLGPAIGPQAFEVGSEVREAFMQKDAQACRAFRVACEDKYYADIYQLARQRLANVGVKQVYGGHYCTWHERMRFFSYRRDGITGRMASFIWLI